MPRPLLFPCSTRRSSLIAILVVLASVALGCSERKAFEVDPSVVSRPLPDRDTPVDAQLAGIGADIFRLKCAACHKLSPGVAVGPNLRGVTDRRSPEWLRGMVLNPDSMLRTDSIARVLLSVYGMPMIDPELGEAAFRAILEYLRTQPAS